MSNAKVRARRRRRAQKSAVYRALTRIVSWDLGSEPATTVHWYTTTEGARPGHHFVIFGRSP